MPISGQIHHSKLLTGASVQYKNDSYIAQNVFPALTVSNELDRVAVYGLDAFYMPETLRANGSPAKEVGHTYSFTSYYLQTHALREAVTDRDAKNADAPINVEVDAVQNITDRLMLRMEYETAKVCFTTTTWGLNDTLVSLTSWRYNTTTSGDPAVNAYSAAAAMVRNSQKRPNKCVIGYTTYQLLANHVLLLDRIKWSQTGKVTEQLIASLFDVDQLLVGSALYAGYGEGLAWTTTSVWTNKALFMWTPASAGLRTPSAGYMLQQGGLFSAKKWRDEEIEGNYVEVSANFLPKAIATSAAFLFAATDL